MGCGASKKAEEVVAPPPKPLLADTATETEAPPPAAPQPPTPLKPEPAKPEPPQKPEPPVQAVPRFDAGLKLSKSRSRKREEEDEKVLPSEKSITKEDGKLVAQSAVSVKIAKKDQMKMLEAIIGTERPKVSLDEGSPVDIKDIGKYRDLLSSPNEDEQHAAALYFRKLLSVEEPPIFEVREAGAVPLLVKLLSDGHSTRVQLEAAWALTNICSGEAEDVQDVVNSNALPLLVRLLATSKSDEVAEQVLWCLGNIAGDGPALQSLVLQAGVVPPLTAVIERASLKVALLRTACWCLSNLVRPAPTTDELVPTVPYLAREITASEDTEVLTHAAWSLACITTSSAVGTVAAINSLLEDNEALIRIIKFVREEQQSSVCLPMLRVLGNLCCSDPDHAASVVVEGGITALASCVKTTLTTAIQKEALMALSNIAAISNEAVRMMCEEGVFATVAAFMHTCKDPAITRECVFVLSNPWSQAAGVSPDVTNQLLQDGMLKDLVTLLRKETPVPVLLVALIGLQDAVKKGQQLMMAQAKEQREARERAQEAAEANGHKPDAAQHPQQPQANGHVANGGDTPTANGGHAAPEEFQQPPLPSNLVVSQLKELGVPELLSELTHHADETIAGRANSFSNILQFMC